MPAFWEMVGDRGFEPPTPTVCMFPENLQKASLTHCLCFLWLRLRLFFLWCPIFTHFILFLPQISHNFSHSRGYQSRS